VGGDCGVVSDGCNDVMPRAPPKAGRAGGDGDGEAMNEADDKASKGPPTGDADRRATDEVKAPLRLVASATAPTRRAADRALALRSCWRFSCARRRRSARTSMTSRLRLGGREGGIEGRGVIKRWRRGTI